MPDVDGQQNSSVSSHENSEHLCVRLIRIMQHMTQHTPPFWSLRIVFTLVLACGVSQGLVETAIAASGQDSGASPSPIVQQHENTILTASTASSTLPNTYANQTGNNDIWRSIPVSHDTVEIMVMSGLFALIGTFFIPHILSYLSGDHFKATGFLEPIIKVFRTLFQMPPHHFAGISGILKMQAAPAFQRPVAPPIPINRPKPIYPRPGDRVLISTPKRKRHSDSPTGVIETFFQQSGFVVQVVSESELVLNSQLARYKQYGKIPVYVMNNAIVDQRHIQAIHAKQKTQRHAQTLAFLIVNAPLEESAYQAIYRYKMADNFTIIPLSHLLVAKSVRHASCAQQLEEKMSASTGSSNLYAMNTPVADPLNFFGRTKIMNQLLNAVGQQQQLAVFGAPKIGKTWLFWQLKERLSAHITIYLDLQQLPKSCSYLYRKIIDECVRDIGFKYPGVTLPQLHLNWTGTTDDDAQKFMHDVVTLWQHVQRKQSHTQIILLIDGAEHLLPGTSNNRKIRNPENALQAFMTAVQQIIAQHACLTTLLAFASPRAFRSTFPKTWTCKRKIALSSLTEEQCNDMITSLGAQMGLQYSEETLSRLYYETGGHPYVTRQVCSLIAKNLRRSKIIPVSPNIDDYLSVQVRDVELAVNEYLEYKSDYLEEFWQQLLPREQAMLRMLVSHESCTRDELMRQLNGNETQSQQAQAFQCLIANDLIEKCEEKYAIKMGLFERIILTQQQGGCDYENFC